MSKGDEALDSYTETLATEYDAAAVEIEAVLAVLGTEREFHRERVVGLLVELERNAAFWEEEIEVGPTETSPHAQPCEVEQHSFSHMSVPSKLTN